MNGDSNTRFRQWQEGIVDVLVGASAVALAVAAVNASAEPILGAIALVGMGLMFSGGVARQPPPPERESASPVPQLAPGFDAPLVDAVSV